MTELLRDMATPASDGRRKVMVLEESLSDALRVLLHEVPQRELEKAWRWVYGFDHLNELPPPFPPLKKVEALNLDELIESVWRGLPEESRKAQGSVYTPKELVLKILDMIGYDGTSIDALIDPSCGVGPFLFEAAQKRFERSGIEDPTDRINDVLVRIIGIDRSNEPLKYCRLLLKALLLKWTYEQPSGDEVALRFADLEEPSLYESDALDKELPERIRTALPEGVKIRFVVGNPPYVERKLWKKYQIPAALIHERFPPGRHKEEARDGRALFGAADLYMAFLLLAEELVDGEGWVSFVLPNKFQVAKYAQYFRKRMRKHERLRFILDVSHIPDLFDGIDVYPIIVGFGPKNRGDKVELGFRMTRLGDRLVTASAEIFDVVDPPVFFTLPSGPKQEFVSRHLVNAHGSESSLAGDFFECRTTCSFHHKGLRELFIKSKEEQPLDTDGNPPVHPYLGGVSFTTRNEVRPYGIEPFGYTISYDQYSLKNGHSNPLPPLESTFLEPKIIYCQHSKSMVAAPDLEGEWVTKDTYQVAHPTKSGEDELLALTAILNSRAFSCLYNLMFRGIAVGSDYLHFLPIYLKSVPLPNYSRRRKELAGLARLACAGDEAAVKKIDDSVFKLYDASEEERAALIDYSNEYLGWDVDSPFVRM